MRFIINLLKSRLADLIVRLKGSNLRLKLSLCFLFIFAIPVVACSLYLFNSYDSSINKDIENQNKQQLNSTITNINRNMTTLISTSEVITQNSKLIDHMAENTDIASQGLIDFKNSYYVEVDNLQSANPAINKISFYINNYCFPEMWPYIYYYERLNNDALKEKMSKNILQTYWEDNHKEKQINNISHGYDSVVSIYSRITDSQYNYLGILEVSMLSSTFFGSEGINPKNQNNLLCSIDSKGKVYNISNNNFFKANNLNKNDLIKTIAKKLKGNKGHLIFDLPGNKNIIMNYQHVNKVNLYVCNISLTQEMIQKISDIRNTIIMIALTTIITLYILTFFATSLLLKKLRIIIGSMRKVQEGNFDVDIPVYGNDEMGELAYHFRKMLTKIDELISDVIRKKVAVKDAEINALHYQINRHFITNTLEKIKILSDEKGQPEISKAIKSLAGITRYNMKWTTEYVSLREEIDYIKSYFQIMMNINNENSSKLIIDIDNEYMEFEILKLSLQPIVENSINYGIRTVEDGKITISAYCEEGFFYICVLDNGTGIPKEKLDMLKNELELNDEAEILNEDLQSYDLHHHGNGIGLQNINKRIKLFYGDSYGVFIESKQGAYTKVILKLPES